MQNNTTMTTIKSKEEALEEEVERLLKEMRKIPMVLIRDEKMYSEEDMIEFNEWVSLNFPNQHNYLRALQKHNQGLYVPKEKLVGYYSTKELLEQFKKK